MKSSSRVYSVQVTAQDGGITNNPDYALHRQRQQQQHSSSRPPAARGNTVQDSAASPGSAYLDPSIDEELTVEVSGPRVHAPWPGLHGVCDGCGAPSVSGLGSGPTECEHCHRQIAGGEGGARKKPSAGGKGSAAAAARRGTEGKEGVVAVTSSREIALGDERAKALARAGAVMLATSSLLLLLLLVAW